MIRPAVAVDLPSYGFRMDLAGRVELLPDVPSALIALHAAPTRQQIERLEDHLVQHEQVEIPATHRFAAGLYAREITIPKGTLMTGKVHRHEHVSVMLSGDMTVLTESGMRRVKGPQTFISPPGTKRVGYAHEETVWLTVHVNAEEERDIEAIESRLVEPWAHAPMLARRKIMEVLE